MKISEYAVKNYQFTLVIFFMTIALGITTLLNMPRSEDPTMNPPQFSVVVIYPGTSPQDMEELVVNPLEKKIYALDDIVLVRSVIKDGVAIMRVEYRYSSSVQEKYQELVREINGMRSELPVEIFSLEVKKNTPSGVNIIQAALISENASRTNMKIQAERLQKELEKITALKEVSIHGLPEEVVRVDLHLEKIAQMNIPLPAVLGAIQNELANIPGGSVEAGQKSFNVKTSGTYRNAADVARTLVYAGNGKTVALGEIAEVRTDFDDTKYITRINGFRALFITAALKDGYNISKIQAGYKPVIESFKEQLPANIDLVFSFDQAESVNRRLGGLATDFIIAILLVSITLLPLGYRAALIVMVSIPLSLSIGLVLLNVLGYNLNQLSIVGLVVALGLLVDDSIVVVENIERWLRDGHSRTDAALLATKQIGISIIGCTVTLIIAFMPLVFLPDSSGEFVRSMPMAVITSVLASMLVSLTIIPFLGSRLLKQHAPDYKGNVFLRALQALISGSYARLLDKALQKPVLTLFIALLVFASSLALFPVIGFSLFPASEKPQFIINIITPLQSSLSTTDKASRDVEKILAQMPEIQYFSSNIGKGNPRIYYNVIPENERSDFAQIFVQLEASTSPARKTEILQKLRSELSDYPFARVEVKNFEQGPPVNAPVEVRIKGDNLDTLRTLANKVEEIVRQTPGTIYIDNPVSHLKTDIRVAVNKEKARMLALNMADVDRTVRMAVAGLSLGSFADPEGNQKKIMLTSPRTERATLASLRHLYVNNMAGRAIPLGQIAKLELESSPLSVVHYNKVRSVGVTAFVEKGMLNDRVIADVMRRIESIQLPEGYSFEMGGEYESRQKSFSGFETVVLVTVFLFIAVLILLFKTFKSTIIVLSVIPLGVVGAAIALWLTGNSLSFVAVIGLIALAGIEVKNSILLVDFTNQLRAEGKNLDEAIREAGEVRFLPIILTSLTAIGGLLPIAWSTNPLIAPLAIVLIGGLISSTLLSRIVTPVVYKLIPPRI